MTAKGISGRKLLSNVSHITVNLVDENDNNPVFNMTKYSFVIKKNLPVKSFVGEVCLINLVLLVNRLYEKVEPKINQKKKSEILKT